ncbi:hypothetical protein SAMN05444422_10325 [Halobiforma haloterrestris]|uniref:DUF2268 domain-containing protein n=1 Tax=Natronobacterium haloterrestre TaxID=148448 RepID=A0A1I1F3W1_NATHA|nr:hypothetical protein [Halobiforma haloterrestris]SFB91843.1 hypothetical protein SAMN05444422_10325 [Halobiforma haloterrestris]
MQIDPSAAELFLGYVDDEVSLERVWEHPAYDVAREHASVLGRDLECEDLRKAVADEETAFSFAGVENLRANRDRIEGLLDHVRARQSEWEARIDRNLERIAPDADTADVTLSLGIGYEFGIGTRRGAYVGLNEPLFLERPRQLLYAGLHECSHVLHERVHRTIEEFGSEPMESRSVQWQVFNAICQGEAYATYAPLAVREADGNLGAGDHPMCEDYRVLEDDARLCELVEEYDSFRQRLRTESVPRETLFERIFAEPRLPYRVGCALLVGLEERRGLEAVQEGFTRDPVEFFEAYDSILDRYRS